MQEIRDNEKIGFADGQYACSERRALQEGHRTPREVQDRNPADEPGDTGANR
jgi:hypothetical protein